MNTKNTDFKQIIIEGYRSYVTPTIFPLDSRGLNLIRGVNGAGKTSIFSALVWCLYKINLNGTANDKVQSWERVRTSEYRGTRVIVMFEQGGYFYMVARHLNFKGTTRGIKGGNGLFVYRREADYNFNPEDMVGEAQHKGDVQEYILRVLGVDSKTFLNSILFGQRMARLVSSDNEEKRKLFETLFDLAFVETAKDKAKEKKTGLDLEISTLNATVLSQSQTLTTLQEKLAEEEKLINEFETTKAERVGTAKVNWNNKITELYNSRQKLTKLKAELDAYPGGEEFETLKTEYEAAKLKWETTTNANKELNNTINATNAEIRTAENNKVRFAQQINDIKTACPTCGSPVAPEEISRLKTNLNNQIKKETEIITLFTKTVNEKQKLYDQGTIDAEAQFTTYNALKVKYDAAAQTKNKLDELKSDIKVAESNVTKLDADTENLKSIIAVEEKALPPKIDTTKTKASIEEYTEKIGLDRDSLATKTEELKRVKWWVDKAFGAGGLKAFVFSAMLNQLNVHIDKYAQRLGLKCRFYIDLTQARKPFVTKCYKGVHEIDYNELSGGQQQLLDVAVGFAMHDLVTEITNMNILILDEIFEGLDPSNIEAVFDLIRVKSGSGKAVYVVTHSQVIDSMGSKNIYIEADEAGRTLLVA